MGIKYFVVEMPVGKRKVRSFDTASSKKFRYIGKQFNMKVKVAKLRVLEPTGHGVGPALRHVMYCGSCKGSLIIPIPLNAPLYEGCLRRATYGKIFFCQSV